MNKETQSTLSKLRSDIESRRDEYRNNKSTKRISKMTENDKILEIRANEMDIVLLLLNELEPEISNEWAREAGKDFAKKHLSQPQPIEKLVTDENGVKYKLVFLG